MARKKRVARKKAKTSTERVRVHRERQGSKVQVNVTLPKTAVTQLDKLCKSSNQSRAAIIEHLLINNGAAGQAKKPKPTARKKKSVRVGECHLCFEWKPDKELDNLGRGEYRYQYAQCKDFGACFERRHPR